MQKSRPVTVTQVDSVLTAQSLAAHLLDPGRTRPVVVISTAQGQPAPYVDPQEVARCTAGAADVYALVAGRPSREFSDGLPDLTQVYGGASRVYPVDPAWQQNPRLSRLHFAYRPDRAGTIAGFLTAEALAAAEAGEYARYTTSGGDRGTGGQSIAARLSPKLIGQIRTHTSPTVPHTRSSPSSHPPPSGSGPATPTPERSAGTGRPLPGPPRPGPPRPGPRGTGPRPGPAAAPARSGARRTQQPDPAVGARSVELVAAPVRPRSPTLDPARSGPVRTCLDQPGGAGPSTSSTDPVPTPAPDPAARALQVELAELRRATSDLRDELAASRTRIENLQRDLDTAMVKADEAAQAYYLVQEGSFHRDEVVFEDELEQFRFEVYQAWAYRITPQEKDELGLARYRVGPDFFSSLAAVGQGISRGKVIDVVVDVLTGRDYLLAGRELHQLRSGTGGDDPPARGPEGELCWRVSLQVKSPAARRLHYWRFPDTSITLSSVRLHDDFRP